MSVEASESRPPLGIVANRRDAALHAFAIMMRTLTEASRGETGRAAEALLEASEALGKLGRGAADMIASMDYRAQPQGHGGKGMSDGFTRTLQTAADADAVASLLLRAAKTGRMSRQDESRLETLAERYRDYSAALRATVIEGTPEPDPDQAALL